MGRTAKNRLTVSPLPSGSYLLHGYLLGKKFRKQSHDFGALMTLKIEKERSIATALAALADTPQPRLTRLTDAQLKDAEAAIVFMRGRRATILQWLTETEAHLPHVSGVKCSDALAKWLETLTERERSKRTSDKNRLRVQEFLDTSKPATLNDITPDMIERWVYRAGADYTRLTDAQVLRAWLNFCTHRARRWLAVSPFAIDMKDLSSTARPVEAGRILTVPQCERLLKAAQTVAAGRLLPYTILTLWCFMRDSEVRRTTRAMLKLDRAKPVIVVEPTKRRTVRYREVDVPANVLPLLREAVKDWSETQCIPFSRSQWARVREEAGLLKRGPVTRNKRRALLDSVWQDDIARHTGISYLYQKTGDIKDVCRQAGNKTDVSFRHYLTLPAEGTAHLFYNLGSCLATTRGGGWGGGVSLDVGPA